MEIDFVEDLKQPEYTGENRCEPCTLLNLAIAVAVGSLVARKTKLGGALAIVVSIGLIYLRGYLVPGTPTLTKRYLPPEVLRWFGKEPEPELASGVGGIDSGGSPSNDATDTPAAAADSPPESNGESSGDDAPEEPVELDLETFFLSHDVLEPCADRDDLCLTDAFEADWLDAIDKIDTAGVDSADAIAAFGFEEDPDEFDIESREDTQLLVASHGIAGRWPSRPALIADIAASGVLEEWTPEWDDQGPETKGQVLNGLRMFLETCPTSGGEISMDEEVVESCCSSHDVIAVTCDETGERLFEQRLDTVGA
ncbi:hypothetical protein [Natronorubrum daqingense]|uniref:Uncharacterized protein n=1 Tax=Natronorubrum daqingense TaxID=588898 RepID=A0A1N7F9M0_9EURY|nr:hypothetical protein [Natronorubrum daqingense]APX97631.1 hypothetical protein BB347_13995 [Natronorubrum daqingense]SIR97027.1 hypothetical protein SAMN05421809_3124 [Natronorubrum daqingense]